MTTPAIQSNHGPALPNAKRAQARPAPKADSQAQLQGDSFDFNKKPDPKTLADARAAIAAAAAIPAIPFSNAAKGPWLDNARKVADQADKAAQTLQDAAFWTHSIPQDEADKAQDVATGLRDKIESCEERAGIKPTPTPANPFRPLGEMENQVASGMNNPVGAVVGVVVLPAAVAVDAVDAATRPVQAVAYPFEWMWRGVKAVGHKLGVG